MRRFRNNPRTGNNNDGLLIRILGFALARFIIPFIILFMKVLAYAIITFIIPFIVNLLRKKINDQQRLLCNKCHGKLKVIDKDNFYCNKCKIIKLDRN